MYAYIQGKAFPNIDTAKKSFYRRAIQKIKLMYANKNEMLTHDF